MFQVPAYGPRQHDLLQVPALSDQVWHGIAMRAADDVLLDDRALVEICRRVVSRRPHELHPPFSSLVVGLTAHERGQERMMDVDDAFWELANESRTEHLHVTGEHDQIDARL